MGVWTDSAWGGSRDDDGVSPQRIAVVYAYIQMATSTSHPHGVTRRARRQSAQDVLLYGGKKRNLKKAIWITVAVVSVLAAVVGTVLATTDIDWARFTTMWERMIAVIAGLNPVLVIPMMAILPIFGFPISVVYLVAGARFGPVGGGLVVLLATTCHMIGTYLVGRSVLRGPLQRYIERKHKHLPQVPVDEQAAVTVIAALVPGLPYVIRNYLLVLAGVRLKYLLLICMPIYVARSYVTILLGDMGSDPSKMGLAILVIIDVLKVAICALVIWRLRVHHRKYHAHDAHLGDPQSAEPEPVSQTAAKS